MNFVALGCKSLPENARNLLRAGAFGLRLDHDDTRLAARHTGGRDRIAGANVVRRQGPGDPVNHRHFRTIPQG